MGEAKYTRKWLIAGSYAAVLGAAFWLLFYHLDNHPLWGDEAETAVLARNVLQFGVPQTYDGTNYILLHGPVDETPGHVWTWSPWLQEYLTATSFMAAGQTTWAARAPFALIGGCSLVALALVVFKIHRSHWAALSAVALLAGSEVFLLHARQCRYYSVSVLAEIFLIYGFYQLLDRNRRGIGVVAGALILQFYSNYIVAFANLPALLFLAWQLRKRGRRALLDVAAAAGIFFAAALPWLVYARVWRQTQAAGGENFAWKAWHYLLEFHFHFLPLFIFLLPLLGLWAARRGRPVAMTVPVKEWERLLSVLLPAYFAMVLAAPGFYLRYLLPILPVACLLAAVWLFRCVSWRAAAVALVALLCASNVLSVITAYPVRGAHTVRFPLADYVRGMASPYADRFTDVRDFFAAHAQPGQRVLSFDPELPLMFYTPLGIIDGRIMAPPDGQLPDWILPQSASAIAPQADAALPDFLKPHYEAITLQVHDSVYGDGVPEPDVYQYRTATNLGPFIIYRLKPGADRLH